MYVSKQQAYRVNSRSKCIAATAGMGSANACRERERRERGGFSQKINARVKCPTEIINIDLCPLLMLCPRSPHCCCCVLIRRGSLAPRGGKRLFFPPDYETVIVWRALLCGTWMRLLSLLHKHACMHVNSNTRNFFAVFFARALGPSTHASWRCTSWPPWC